ncbi:MAG: hypothetical protein ACYC4U_23630 [Pirellulaceae bacterium]
MPVLLTWNGKRPQRDAAGDRVIVRRLRRRPAVTPQSEAQAKTNASTRATDRA